MNNMLFISLLTSDIYLNHAGISREIDEEECVTSRELFSLHFVGNEKFHLALFPIRMILPKSNSLIVLTFICHLSSSIVVVQPNRST